MDIEGEISSRSRTLTNTAPSQGGHIGTSGTLTPVPSATTVRNGRERHRLPDMPATGADTRHGGDNDTSPRKPEPESAEARPGEARLGPGYALGGFDVRLCRSPMSTPSVRVLRQIGRAINRKNNRKPSKNNDIACFVRFDGSASADGFCRPRHGAAEPSGKENVKMFDANNEISRTPPQGAPERTFTGGTPILYAFECALLEIDMDGYFLYKAVNLKTGRSEKLFRRKTPLAPNDVGKAAERIRGSSVAGAARIEADRRPGERISYDKCREILYELFERILPEYGCAVRREQVSLADFILQAFPQRIIALAEAEVGTGKTLAYLAAAILAGRGRLNDFWNKGYYPKMHYADTAQMPIVIATSSIALQKALVTEYIPELSRILLENGIIKTPLTAVLRKGREHYVCERNLRNRLRDERDERTREILDGLLAPKASADLAETDELTSYIKRKISVPGKCDASCPYRDTCAYLKFRSGAMSGAIDIQVVNHNYFLADAIRRANDKRPLLPNYQIAIIDEAHKFLSAARSMYGEELSSFTLPDIMNRIGDLRFGRESARKSVLKTAKKLSGESKRLFGGLLENAGAGNDNDDEADRFAAVIDKDAARRLRNLRNIAGRLYEQIASEPARANGGGKRADILWDLASVRERLNAFVRPDEHILWLDLPDINATPGTEQEILLCSVPKDLDARLCEDLWSKGIPTVLTSGTLSAGGDFTHIKRTLGLDKLKHRPAETSKSSPFDHRKNTLLYISETMPFPDIRSSEYIAAVADEVEKLVIASCGHAAVLFTSYKAMDMVWEKIAARRLPFPLFRLDKGGVREIEKFKQSGGGVLFAAGALWEGINIPGDALSMLIIVKLPFKVPDPISAYEQTLYPNFHAYRDAVILPEMLIKLKQGCGRLIRTETDTGCIAILDSRAGKDGPYRAPAGAALPDCRVTDSIADIEDFIRAVKAPEYFK
jgi:ATP-dependent DNA helicase DinG